MKATITPTAKFIALLAFIVLFGSSFTLHKGGSEENMEDVCLQISGKIGFEGYTNDRSYKIELIHYNTVIKTETVKGRSAFNFLLKKNAYYTIRISKKGYATRLVSICTVLDKKTEEKGVFCQFHFTTNLIPASKANYLNQDALDFPIAIVAYNKAKKNFYDSKKYTTTIKKVLYSGPTAN